MTVSPDGVTAAGRVWRQVTLRDGSVYYYCPDTYETCLTLPVSKPLEPPLFTWV